MKNQKKDNRFNEIKVALSTSYKEYRHKNYAKAHEILTAIITKPLEADATEYTAGGHAHIDLAWLWPIRETKRKGVRTYATALHNFEKDIQSFYPVTSN